MNRADILAALRTATADRKPHAAFLEMLISNREAGIGYAACPANVSPPVFIGLTSDVDIAFTAPEDVHEPAHLEYTRYRARFTRRARRAVHGGSGPDELRSLLRLN